MFADNAKCTPCTKKYSYYSLYIFCKDNNIDLLKDYSTTKLNQYSNIEGT